MPNSSEGVRRLSLFAGSICGFVGLVRIAWISEFFTKFGEPFDPIRLVLFIVFVVICFLIPWAFVHAVAWVVWGLTRK